MHCIFAMIFGSILQSYSAYELYQLYRYFSPFILMGL